MGKHFLEARLLSFIASSHPNRVRNHVESILYVHGWYFSGRQIPEERMVKYSWTPRLGITSISFPSTEPLTERAVCIGFERGLWITKDNLVCWVVTFPDDTDNTETCVFFDESAIAARSVLYGIISGLKTSIHQCRSGWGSTPDIQCIGCGRLHVIGLGWSENIFTPLKSTPKICCPGCYPSKK